MSKHTRIPVGDGKYCYSGPNCAIHGVKSDAPKAKTKEQVALAQIQIYVQDNIEKVEATEQKYLCATGQSIYDMKKAYKGLVNSARLGRWCHKHQTNHIYSISDFNYKIVRPQTFHIAKAVAAYIKENGVEGKNIPIMVEYANALAQSLHKRSLSQDKKNLRDIDPEYYDSFAELVEKKRAAAIAGITYEGEIKREALVLPDRKLNDAEILEYWQCGRKSKHSSSEDAKTHRISVGDPNMHEYKCPHCGEFHNGHGDGQSSIESQIKKARAHWRKFPNKANSFVESKQWQNR